MSSALAGTVAGLLAGLALVQSDASGQPTASAEPGPVVCHDGVVYGASSGAAIAAMAAKREGRSVIWLNPAGFPGGMSASGLGATDFGGKRNTFGGIAAEFYDGAAKACQTNNVRNFEPRVHYHQGDKDHFVKEVGAYAGQQARQGLTVFPHVGSSDPETKYAGGYIVGAHGSSSGGTIDAIQLVPAPEHRDPKALEEMVDKDEV